jgi:hypothetical protein
MQEPITRIYGTIEEYNTFLWDIIGDDHRQQIVEYIEHLDILNGRGEYEKWMSTRWDEFEWWLAAAIKYGDMTMARIRDSKFQTSQLKKLHSNTLQKKKIKKGDRADDPKYFKNKLVEAWLEYCQLNNVDPYTFEMGMINGVNKHA